MPTKAQDTCFLRLERLRELGHELRRPEGDYFRDGIYELRASLQGVHYCILYFFHAAIVVVSHGIVKEQAVPPKERERAIGRKRQFEMGLVCLPPIIVPAVKKVAWPSVT